MKFLFKLLPSLSLLVVLFISSCRQPEVDENGSSLMKSMGNDVYHEWNNVFMQTEQFATFYRPGPAPRALAYMGYSAYEACLGGMSDYQTLQYRFGITDLPPVQTNLYWPEVVNASYAYLMNRFFDNVTFKDRNGNLQATNQFLNIIASKEKELKAIYRAESIDAIIERSEAHGRQVADAIWRYASSDIVGHNGHLNPFPIENNPKNTCDWVATDPQLATRGMFSQWGKVRTFATTLNDLDALKAPAIECNDDSTSLMYAQALEMRAYAENARKDPTGELECIAEFWSDDRVGWTFSPATRFIAIADQIVEKENYSLETTCVLYAQIGMALNDACVMAWYNKYKYDLERPITYIHRNIDPNFTVPWLGFNPSFPAYPSGHSSFGYAGATTLEYYTGANYSFTDHCHELRTDFCGTPRQFRSLHALAYENAFSRLPLAVHWRVDMEGGDIVGTLCATRVHELPWKK